MSFSGSTNIQFTIWGQFLQFKACKSGEIDTIGIEVAQQIKLSGCPTKGHFTAESGKNALVSNDSSPQDLYTTLTLNVHCVVYL